MIDPQLREDRSVVTPRLLRQFAALSIVLFSTLSLIELYGRHRSGRAELFALLAIAIGARGLLWPTAIGPIFTTAVALTAPIGWVVSRVVLVVIFYVVFTPIALVFRLTRRDALRLHHDSHARTYWRRWRQPSDPRSYLHQS